MYRKDEKANQPILGFPGFLKDIPYISLNE